MNYNKLLNDIVIAYKHVVFFLFKILTTKEKVQAPSQHNVLLFLEPANVIRSDLTSFGWLPRNIFIREDVIV